MSTKKINTSNLNTDLNTDHLTPEQKEELEKLIKEITEEAKSVIEDYIKNPSELSGSTVHFHTNSPLLEENN